MGGSCEGCLNECMLRKLDISRGRRLKVLIGKLREARVPTLVSYPQIRDRQKSHSRLPSHIYISLPIETHMLRHEPLIYAAIHKLTVSPAGAAQVTAGDTL